MNCTIIRTTLYITLILMFCNAFGQKKEKVYLNSNESSKNCYTIVYPAKIPWKGFLILLPGFGETAERVFQETDLPIKTAQNGILTIIPTLQEGATSFGIDSASQKALVTIIKDVTNKFKLIDQPLYIGGFSLGGSTAVKYAENPYIKPAAVFAIDPPLDFERFYKSSKRDVRLSGSGQLNQENVYMLKRIEQIMGGSPENKLSSYYKISPYSYTDTTQSAIKPLLNSPIRIYAEPDINWWMTNRGADVSGINVTDASAMINELKRLGNTKANLMITHNMGYRNPAHTRHPHSWSIANTEDLIKWLLVQR